MAPSTPQFVGSTFHGAGDLAGPPLAGPVFDAENVRLQRWMRFNPLRALDPENLSLALDQFETGILRQAALLWDAMLKRDDTLSFVAPQLENSIAAKPWGVFQKRGADPREAARHAAALQYFYDHVIATDAFDRNVRGDRHLLLKQMGTSHALRYAVHHFIWRREPGKMIEVPGAEPVPALTATMEAVPLWFFENTTGTLRFLPFGGFGIDGVPLNWDGEWMVTTGTGIMFAASICYVFKRLTFQDWTIFNERYAQQKVVGQTTAQKDSAAGQALAEIVSEFNSDQGIVIYEAQAGDKLPISLLGPNGTVSVDLFERFLDRQDRKMAVMFRGSDLRNMSRDGQTTGVSAQNQETEALEIAHCAAIASACRSFIDRAVIRYSFGEGVEPLAYFGLPETNNDDLAEVRNSAGFLADRGAFVDRQTVAQRLGITLATNEADALKPAGKPAAEKGAEETLQTSNANSNHDERGRFASGPGTGYGGVHQWSSVGGQHFPVQLGQNPEAAHAKHQEWLKTATEEEKAHRQEKGRLWHIAQKNSVDRAIKESQPISTTEPNHDKDRQYGKPSAGPTAAGSTGETSHAPPSVGAVFRQSGGEGSLDSDRQIESGGSGGHREAALRETRDDRGGASRVPGSEAALSWDRLHQARLARLERAAGRAGVAKARVLAAREKAAAQEKARAEGKPPEDVKTPAIDGPHIHGIVAGEEHLRELRRHGAIPTATSRRDWNHLLDIGGEHYVEMDPRQRHRPEEMQWVTKHTLPGRFGFRPFLGSDHRIGLRGATASEYMDRMRLLERLFGTGNRLLGSHDHARGGFTTVQPYFAEPVFDEKDVRKHMERHGFRQVGTEALPNEHYAGSVWFHPGLRYLIADAFPGNFRRHPNGRIHPVDVLITRVREGSAMHKLASRHLLQFSHEKTGNAGNWPVCWRRFLARFRPIVARRFGPKD